MIVVVRFLDPGGIHLKSEAEKLGRTLIKLGGGGSNKIMDGFIVRAVATAKTAVVTVLGMPYVFTSPIQNFYPGMLLVREVRLLSPDGRKGLDAPGVVPAPIEAPYRVYQDAVVVISTPGVLQQISTGTWATTDPVFHPGVITEAAVRLALVGSTPYVDTVIYRSTVGRKMNELADGQSFQFRSGTGFAVTAGEIGMVMLSAAAMGFSPGSSSSPILGGVTRATEISADQGFVVTYISGVSHFVRYGIDLPTSILTVEWSRAVSATGIHSLFYAGGLLRGLQYVVDLEDDDDTNDHIQLVTLDIATGAGPVTDLWPFAEGQVYNPTPYIMDDAPWFFCPRRKNDPDSNVWSKKENLDVVLVGPAGQVIQVDTPGYIVQRGVNRVSRGGGTDDGTVYSGGGALAGTVAYYGTTTFPEYGVSNVCAYAPGILAVVVIPDAQYAEPTQDRYLALIDASTGGMLQVSGTPLASQDIWYGVSLSCFEQGEVDNAGELIVHGALLVSVFRPYVAALDGGTAPDPTANGVWVTIDAGATLQPLYQQATYSAAQPVQRATYLGSPLIPASIGRTRNQWVTGRDNRVI